MEAGGENRPSSATKQATFKIGLRDAKLVGGFHLNKIRRLEEDGFGQNQRERERCVGCRPEMMTSSSISFF